jgi:hypothetical protein
MAADAPRSIVASWDTAHKASMLLGRRERKGLCRPRARPENPLELVLVCLNNSTGFFAQTVARFEGECQGTATPCRETPDWRQSTAAATKIQQGPRRDEKNQIIGDVSYAHAGPRRAWCVGCRAGVSRAMLSSGREGAAVQDGAAGVMDGSPRLGMPERPALRPHGV